MVRRKVYARFLDAVNFVTETVRRSGAGGDQPLAHEQCSELSAVSASFVLSTPTETMALFFRDVSCWPTPAPGPIAGECGYRSGGRG
ncbi:phage minor tail L family protein [Escherichia coli 2866750]|nr:phage minor tail L family protein [Escherichia coli 2866750]